MSMRTLLAVLALALCASSSRAAGSEGAFLNAAGSVHEALSASFKTAAAARQEVRDEEDALLGLLDSPDASVRLSAARSLKKYAESSERTRSRLLSLFQDRSENAFVRREAARALSWGGADPDVRQALLETAQRRSEPAVVREMSYKALYWQAQNYSDIREALLDAAKRDSDVNMRQAALWALFTSANFADVRDGLLDIAQRDGSVFLRVAALKSLWGEMGLPEVRELARGYAKERSTPALVRQAGILMLSVRFESEDTDLLEDIAKNDWDANAKQAAILALDGPDRSEVIDYFHSFHFVWRNGIRYVVGDPIDQE